MKQANDTAVAFDGVGLGVSPDQWIVLTSGSPFEIHNFRLDLARFIHAIANGFDQLLGIGHCRIGTQHLQRRAPVAKTNLHSLDAAQQLLNHQPFQRSAVMHDRVDPLNLRHLPFNDAARVEMLRANRGPFELHPPVVVPRRQVRERQRRGNDRRRRDRAQR
jgi:hypothetical protein